MAAQDCFYSPTCLGTCGNILSLIVLSRKRLRKYSTTMYLLFLAGSDLSLLWSSVLRRIFQFVARIDIRNSSEFQCRTNDWLSMTSGSFSICLLVLLTIERAVITKSPVFAKRKMTRRFALVLCLSLLLVIALINIHYVFGRRLRYVMSKVTNENDIGSDNLTTTVVYHAQCSYVSVSYAKFAQKLWPAIGLGIFNLLPVVVIFTGNFSIFLKLRQQRRKLQPALSGVDQIGYDRNTRATKMLFVLCGFFLLTVTPYSVFFTVYYIIRTGLSDQHFAALKLCYAIIMILLWSNFTFNFFLYFVSGSLFKKEWDFLVADLKEKIASVFGEERHSQTIRPPGATPGSNDNGTNSARNLTTNQNHAQSLNMDIKTTSSGGIF